MDVGVSYQEWRTARIVIEYSATAAGALSGCLHAIRREFDPVGAFVVAVACGLGGGILRDVMMARGPALALRHPGLLLTVFVTCGLGLLLGLRSHSLSPVLWFVDAAYLGLATIAGIQRAEEARLSAVTALFLGVVTGTGGGLVRDVLCRETPKLLVPGIPHATASLFGGLVYFASLRALHLERVFCEWLGILSSFALRAVGSWRHWILPRADELFAPRSRRSSRRQGR